MENVLTNKEKEVLNYLTEYMDKFGYPPTNRDISHDLGIKSTATVHARLKKLEESGYIRTPSNRRRAIELSNKPSVVNIPMVGQIAAGQPILAEQNIDGFYPLPSELFGNGELMMLKVKGESMIEAGIFDGDCIVIKQQPTADNGQIVAAMIDDSATVKQFYKENGHFRLQPCNATMTPIISDQVEIIGIVVGLLRKM